jgi:RNA polymerase sigma-70 factor, ECF subfamily
MGERQLATNSLPQGSQLKSNNALSSTRAYGFAELQAFPDEQLMEYVKAARMDALGVLFDRYRRLVLSIGFKILRDRGEAEDMAQSVFLEVYRVAGQFNAARGSTKTWLLQYVYHRSINRRRYLLRRDFYAPGDFEDVTEKARLECLSARNVFSSVEARKMLSTALLELSSAQRRTIEMAYFEGLTVGEISEKTGESIVSVRHHYYRGLRRLRGLITQPREQGTELVTGHRLQRAGYRPQATGYKQDKIGNR